MVSSIQKITAHPIWNVRQIMKIAFPWWLEEHAKSRHFLINMSVPKFPKIALEPPEYPKIGKHLTYEYL